MPHTALTRRDFLTRSLSTGLMVAAGSALPTGLDLAEVEAIFGSADASAASEVFPQGIASGDPAPRGIVLWTRIDPTIAGPKARLGWEIARHPDFGERVLWGTVHTSADRDHTVKLQLADKKSLEWSTTYYYRFVFDGYASRTGRFRTLPRPGAPLASLRFGYTSCQDYTNGYYNALRSLAGEDIDYVIHLGDYIYETTGDSSFQGGGPPERRLALPSGRDRAEDLADYRFLYRTYKSDPDLQLLHERFAFINIWDDHEFANDCYREYDSDTTVEADNFDPQRRQDANQAWAEFIPAGVPYDPRGDAQSEIAIYRSFVFGDLAELVLTDERLYRDGPPCGLGTTDKYLTPGCGAESAPGRTMLGSTQRDWFLDRLRSSPARWRMWGNETMVMELKLAGVDLAALLLEADDDQLLALASKEPSSTGTLPFPIPEAVYVNLDQWDGYQAERAHIAQTVRDGGVDNLVVITGDLHSYGAGYLKVDYADLSNGGPNVVGTCFLAGSVTSSNLVELAARVGLPASSPIDFTTALLAANPHLSYFNSSTHGYNLVELTGEKIRVTMRAVNTIQTGTALTTTLKIFEVAAGSNAITEVLV